MINWDDDLPGYGLRVFVSSKKSYVVQYRALGRERRYTIGLHEVWSLETARQEAKILLGCIASGDNPSEKRLLDHKSITIKKLCNLYLADLKAGLILGKGDRPKKASTILTDTGRIERHIIPLLGVRRVKDLTKVQSLPTLLKAALWSIILLMVLESQKIACAPVTVAKMNILF